MANQPKIVISWHLARFLRDSPARSTQVFNHIKVPPEYEPPVRTKGAAPKTGHS